MTKQARDAGRLLRALRLDAMNRAARTLYQLVVVGLVIDVVPLITDALDSGDPVDLASLVKAAARSALGALVAYMMRRYGDSAPIPTPATPAAEVAAAAAEAVAGKR